MGNIVDGIQRPLRVGSRSVMQTDDEANTL